MCGMGRIRDKKIALPAPSLNQYKYSKSHPCATTQSHTQDLWSEGGHQCPKNRSPITNHQSPINVTPNDTRMTPTREQAPEEEAAFAADKGEGGGDPALRVPPPISSLACHPTRCHPPSIHPQTRLPAHPHNHPPASPSPPCRDPRHARRRHPSSCRPDPTGT